MSSEASRYAVAICSGVSPAPRLSNTTDTITRVPLMQAWPWQTAGSTVILSRQSIISLGRLIFSMRECGAKSNQLETVELVGIAHTRTVGNRVC